MKEREQDIEHCHDCCQASCNRESQPMVDALEIADDSDHRQSCLHRHAVILRKPKSESTMIRPSYQSDPNFTWRRASKEVLQNQHIDHVTGNPSLFRSSSDDQENLELLVSRNGVIHYHTQPFR